MWQPLGGTIWNADNPVTQATLHAAYGFGWMLILLSTFLINHFDLCVCAASGSGMSLPAIITVSGLVGTAVLLFWVRHETGTPAAAVAVVESVPVHSS